jgi:prepilin-type N-terminal cleavage/methylation domain-containing protein
MARAARCSRARGFTLFEVMAAVLVLGILYTVLASTAIQGLRAEGDSKRRMEASLVADEYLAQIEAGIASGVFPELGTTQEELEGGYQVVVEVVPFDPSPYLGEKFKEQLPQPGDPTPSLLAPPARPDQSLLRSVSVSVRWVEPEGEHEARRATLAYDAATIASLFPDQAGAESTEVAGDESDAASDEDLNPTGDPDARRKLDELRERFQ